MNYINKFQNHILIVISLTICIVALIVTANQMPLIFDTYWHIATGRDFLVYGDSPFKDHFTFTHYGESIKSNPIVFQIILAKLTSAFGFDNGIFLLKFCVFSCFGVAIYYFYKTNKIHILAVFATLPFIIFFLMQRGGFARPELLSYVLLIISLILYGNSIRNFSSKNLVLICILLIIWGNYHTPVIGYIIVFGLFFEKGIFKLKGNLKLKEKEPFSWRFYFTWALAIFLTGFININLNHFIFSQLSFSDEWKYLISEFSIINKYYSTSFRTIFFSSSIILMIWLFVKQRYGMLFVCVLLVAQTLVLVRLISYSGIIIACLYSIFLSSLLQEQTTSSNTIYRNRTVKQTIIFSIILISIAGHIILGYRTYTYYLENASKKDRFPSGIISHLEQSRFPGNIFNVYHLGGYLAYKLPREFKSYIDGRSNILFSIDFYKSYLRTKYSASRLNKEVEKYNIKYAILENTPQRYDLIANTGIFSVDYVDQNYFLATTEAGDYSISGKILMQPACWGHEITPSLIKEIEKGKHGLPTTSPLREIHIQLNEYSLSSDKQLFFQHQIDNIPNHDDTKRVIAYLALKLGYIEQSILLFKSIDKKVHTDILAISIAFVDQKQFHDAYQVITSNFLLLDRIQSSSIKEITLDIIKSISEAEKVITNEQILNAVKNVAPVNNASLKEKLCTTKNLPDKVSIITDSLKSESQEDK